MDDRQLETRAARRDSSDDIVIPFGTVRSRMSGRVVRLGAAVDRILSQHDYPAPVSELLGEALALTALLGAPLKADGRLILQTTSDGAVRMLVAHYDAPGAMRGYAGFDRERVAELERTGKVQSSALLGKGRMAMTIDPGSRQTSYQGIVALEQGSLTDAAHAYFRQSEQLPTFIRLGIARQLIGSSGDGGSGWRWRVGGLIVQHVPAAGGEPRAVETAEERDARLHGEDDENWVRVSALAATVEAHELIDPTLSPERLLFRLFHEEGVRVAPEIAIASRCRCSRERIHFFLQGFSTSDLAEMREADGGVTVTCEFCSSKYRFTEGEVG